MLYVSTTQWLRLQQEAEWVNINFERRNLNSPQKCHPAPNDLGEICFFLCFQFKKTKCNRFFFHLFNSKLCTVPLNYYCQALQVFPHRVNNGLSDNGCSSVPLNSASSPSRGVDIEGTMGVKAPHFNFQTKLFCKSFSFKHQGYCFLRMFRNYAD